MDVAAFAFVSVRAPSDVRRVAELAASLDPGESEAIVLAEESGACQLLMDEVLGRATAAKLGLKTIGVMGILLGAKKAGMIPAVAPLVDRLRSELRFFVSDRLRAEVLRLAGE